MKREREGGGGRERGGRGERERGEGGERGGEGGEREGEGGEREGGREGDKQNIDKTNKPMSGTQIKALFCILISGKDL